MTASMPVHAGWRSLLLPGTLLLAIAGLLSAQTGLLTPAPARPAETIMGPATVIVPAHSYSYRASGDYQQGGRTVDAPLLTSRHDALEIMTHQVSDADYARCVAAGACEPAELRRKAAGNVAVTGISYEDAGRYATWLSRETGATWRLPTIAEWTFAAGSKASDPALGIAGDDPAQRWLVTYEKEAALDAGSAPPLPLGAHGTNEFGVADLAGNVWEWTSTCHSRTWLDAVGSQVRELQACGVRLLEGRHRTAMSYFVRDARTGGCSTGVPPDNLGFRLVRERSTLEALLAFLIP